jgi:hypothetical protein
MEGRNELDRLIDRALADYSGADPLAGLEERLLNRIRVMEAGRGWRFAWALACVAVAALVGAVIGVRAPRAPVLKHSDVAVAMAHGGRVREAEKPGVTPKRLVKPRAPRQRVLPKREQFPAPAPMTAEERALAAFVGQHPAEAQKVLADLRKRSDEPIEIPLIQIPPLRSDGAR